MYKLADAYCDEGEYGKAYNIYKTLNVYGDREERMYLILELYAYDLREEGNYEEALAAYKAVRDAGYGNINTDYSIYAVEYYILEEQYNDALALMEEEKYEEALAAFEAMDEFEQGSKAEISRKVNERIKECRLAIESDGMLRQ